MTRVDIELYAARHPHLSSEHVEPHLLEWLARTTHETVLDVGCGSGRLIAALEARHVLDPASAKGVDLSVTHLARLRTRLPHVAAAVDDAETLATVPDAAIDFVISTQVLEHVDDARMLIAVRRVLRPSGTAYISTVFKRPWAHFIWRTPRGEWALDPTHLREYTDEAELLRLIERAGLRLIDSRMVPLSFPALDFVVRRLSGLGVDPEAVIVSRLGRLARRARVLIPGYFTWSLVLQPASQG